MRGHRIGPEADAELGHAAATLEADPLALARITQAAIEERYRRLAREPGLSNPRRGTVVKTTELGWLRTVRLRCA